MDQRNVLARSFNQCSITSSSLDDLHAKLRTFVNTSKFEHAGEETVQTLFTTPRDGDAQDKSFAKLRLDETDDDERKIINQKI